MLGPDADEINLLDRICSAPRFEPRADDQRDSDRIVQSAEPAEPA